jgi:hypothetical protein
MGRSIAVTMGLLLGWWAGTAPSFASSDLLARMAAVNPNVHSFSATLHAEVTMRSFPFLHVSLVGTYYHQEPDQTKVVFTSGVPVVAEQFDKLYAHIESPSRWTSVYHVTVVGDTGTVTTFRLVPIVQGNVNDIIAKVADKTATLRSMRWNYANGGYAEMNDRYSTVNGNRLVTSQTGHVQEPGYVADITSTIDNYTINPTLPKSIFAEQ